MYNSVAVVIYYRARVQWQYSASDAPSRPLIISLNILALSEGSNVGKL